MATLSAGNRRFKADESSIGGNTFTTLFVTVLNGASVFCGSAGFVEEITSVLTTPTCCLNDGMTETAAGLVLGDVSR